MNILNLLSLKSYLTVNKQLAKIVGLEASVLFADLAGSQLYWESEGKLQDGYFFRTQAEIEEQTTLSPKVQQRCCKELQEKGLLKSKLKGLPAVKHYSIDESCIANLINMLSIKIDTSFYKNDKLHSTNVLTIKNINNKEYNNKEYNDINNVETFFEVNQNEIIEKKDKHIKKEKPKTYDYSFPMNFDDELKETFETFLKYKIEKKEPYKGNTSVQILLNQISKYIDVYDVKLVNELILICMANNYSGIIFDKLQKMQEEKTKFINKNNLKDDKGNYADTQAGREQFTADIREGVKRRLEARRNGETDNFGF